MISLEIFEPDENCDFKCVYYRDSDDKVIRETQLDKNNNVIRDCLIEYGYGRLMVSMALIGQDNISMIAVRKYHYYEDSDLIKTVEEFKHEEGQEIRTQVAEYKYIDKTSTVTIYDESNNPVGYELYGYRKNDDFMSLLGFFNMSNEEVSVDIWNSKMKALNSYF